MLFYIAVSILVLAADQLSKLWAVRELLPVGSISVIDGLFSLTYAENTGAAFSILQGQRWFFLVLGVAVLAALCVMWARGHFPCVTARLAVALTFAGILGNLIDRARQGYVVDMFELTFINFAIFNVADMALTLGVGLLIFFILTHKEPARENPDADSDA